MSDTRSNREAYLQRLIGKVGDIDRLSMAELSGLMESYARKLSSWRARTVRDQWQALRSPTMDDRQ